MMQKQAEKSIKWQKNQPNPNAGINNIQVPGDSKLIVWQTRDHEPSGYELDLASNLIKAFSNGAESLTDVVNALNEQGMLRENGEAFNTENFVQEIERLGY